MAVLLFHNLVPCFCCVLHKLSVALSSSGEFAISPLFVVMSKHDKHNSHMRGRNIKINITSNIGLIANSPEEGRKLMKNPMETKNKILEKKNYYMMTIQAATIAKLWDLSKKCFSITMFKCFFSTHG